MIYLILKMFFYLLLALLAGAAAGWILRHIMAAKQDEDMQRTLADARARVPQFESLIRSRDEQINRLKDELKDKDVRINGLVEDVRKAENDAKDNERALKQHIAQHETLEDLADADSDGDAGQLLDNDGSPVNDPVAEASVMGGETLDVGPVGSSVPSNADPALQAQLIRLEKELRAARGQAADATAEAAAAEAEVLTLKSELAKAEAEASTTAASADTGAVDGEGKRLVAELEARLAQKTMDYERLARDLEVEKRRVTELERERELQNKSLQVLHQQLELEKERGQRAANG